MCQFSIIVPCYKMGDNVVQLFEMLHAEDYEDYEVVFVDDCSPDETYARLQKEKEGYSNYFVYQTPKNGGPGPARNFGLSKVKGKYVLFCDSDDVFDSSCLKKMDAFLRAHEDAEMVVFPLIVKRGESESLNDTYIKYRDGEKMKVSDVVLGNGAPYCKVFVRDIIEKNAITFPKRMTGEDIVFCVTYAGCIQNAYKSGVVYYTYVMNESSITHTHKSPLDEPTTFDLLYEIYHEKFPEIEVVRFVDSHLLTKAKNLCAAKVSNRQIKEFFDRENKRYPNWIEQVDYDNQSIYRKMIYSAMYHNRPWMIKAIMWIRRILY